MRVFRNCRPSIYPGEQLISMERAPAAKISELPPSYSEIAREHDGIAAPSTSVREAPPLPPKARYHFILFKFFRAVWITCFLKFEVL